MKIMVLGGAGFIGSYLCERLLSKGHDVVAIDNFMLGTRENLKNAFSNDRFQLLEGDISSLDYMLNVFDQIRPDCIYHLAANSDIQKSALNPEIEYKNTFSTTFVVLECMRRYNVSKLFFASSSAVYGDKKNELLSEDTAKLQPVSYYGAAKLGSEALINAYTYMNNFESVIFRFPNVVGARATHGVIFDFVKRLRENSQELTILGDGTQSKPYIFIDDLIDVIMKITMQPLEKGNVQLYNIGVNGVTCVSRIADIVCEEMGLEHVRYIYTGGKVGWKGDVAKYQFVFDKILKTGWKPLLSSDESVREAVKGMLRE